MTGAAGERIASLLGELRSIEDSRARERAEEAIRLVLELYGSALYRALEIVHESGEGGLVDRLGDDPLVGSLLVVHGIHPLDVEERVARALETVRPYLGSHGGDVSIASVSDGVVTLRLAGSCDGCPSSAVTMKTSIEKAIFEAAPEIERVDVESSPPASTSARELPGLALPSFAS